MGRAARFPPIPPLPADQALCMLRPTLDEGKALLTNALSHEEFVSWQSKVEHILRKAFGSSSPIVTDFHSFQKYSLIFRDEHQERAERLQAASSAVQALEKCLPLLEIQASTQSPQHTQGNRIFIGHGRSAAWRDLRDFLKERLHLAPDEFNRVPVAGVTTVDRLKGMLGAASFAFLVLTGEDETAEGQLHARQNVIHEVGLFQGRLGFEKAIVLLEEGCEEFSNIQGLGQIRFPKGDISAKFEEVRRVLEHHGLINGDGTAF